MNARHSLSDLASYLDISPTDYERAVRSYTSLGHWIEEGFDNGDFTDCYDRPVVYPHGSISIGTVVKPFKKSDDPEYDIDLVCELPCRDRPSPEVVKHSVGDRIKQHQTYRQKLEREGKRCWTISYAESEGASFHLDILPAIHGNGNGQIQFTQCLDGSYQWRPSNPKGFSQWFHERNVTYSHFAFNQKAALLEKATQGDGTLLYASVEDVPDQLVRTPLQRAIQILKRHRDVNYDHEPAYKPISIIITTLAARAYTGEHDTLDTVSSIINVLSRHAGFIDDVNFSRRLEKSISAQGLITRRPTSDGVWEWYIPNPVDPEENFADKWHLDDNRRAREFFEWLKRVKADIYSIAATKTDSQLSEEMHRTFGWFPSDAHQSVGKREDIEYPEVTIKQDNGPKPWGT